MKIWRLNVAAYISSFWPLLPKVAGSAKFDIQCSVFEQDLQSIHEYFSIVDVNECTDGSNPCEDERNSTCQNTVGSYACVCDVGYQLRNSAGNWTCSSKSCIHSLVINRSY